MLTELQPVFFKVSLSKSSWDSAKLIASVFWVPNNNEVVAQQRRGDSICTSKKKSHTGELKWGSVAYVGMESLAQL